jgi:hypothetical protein
VRSHRWILREVLNIVVHAFDLAVAAVPPPRRVMPDR